MKCDSAELEPPSTDPLGGQSHGEINGITPQKATAERRLGEPKVKCQCDVMNCKYYKPGLVVIDIIYKLWTLCTWISRLPGLSCIGHWIDIIA